MAFKRADATVKHRLIVSVEALEKQGKTHFALTAPGPIALINLDLGLEGVLHKFTSSKDVDVANYRPISAGGDPASVASAASAVWNEVVRDYHAALAKYRTVVIDTATEAWELLRLARFGKLTQVMPHHYGPVNAEFRNLLRAAYDHDANLILLHKLKPEYDTKVVNGKEVSNRTGRYVRAGFGDIGFAVQVTTRACRNQDGDFVIEILDCRQNAEVRGMELVGDMCTFPYLGMVVLEGSDESDWK